MITALRDCGRDRVEIALDGAPWRTVPTKAAAEARLTLDVALDRERARDLNRALRRCEALSAGLRHLRWSGVSRRALEQRLSTQGFRGASRDTAIETLERLGLLDDRRAAGERAAQLAERGAGDAMISADLDDRGFRPDVIRDVLETLEAEGERASRLVSARGCSRRTLRYLSSRGFSEETIETFVAGLEADA